MHSLAFSFSFRNPEADDDLAGVLRTHTSTFYVPRRRYGGRTLQVELSDGEYSYDEGVRRAICRSLLPLILCAQLQTLHWRHGNTRPGALHTLELTVLGPPSRPRPPDIDLPTRHWLLLAALAGLSIALLEVLRRRVMT